MEIDANAATLIAGAAGVVGSIIGGVAGYLGSKSAAKDSIQAQRAFFEDQLQKEEERRKEHIKTSARIIMSDLFSAIKEIIRITRNDQIPFIGRGVQLISYDKYFIERISVLSGLLKMSDVLLIYNFYGYMEKYNKFALEDSKSINNAFSEAQMIAKAFGIIIFGAFFERICQQNGPGIKDYKELIEEIGIETNKALFYKIKKLV